MNDNTTIAAILALVFLVLGLVAIFRFDRVKNTFEGLGFKLGITGSREKRDKQDKPDLSTGDKPGGTSSVSVGGNVRKSTVLSKGSKDSKVDIKKDVEDSNINSEGG